MNKSVIIILLINIAVYVSCERSFTIDHTNNTFLRDGKPFRYISGDFAYFKVPSALWKDRLIKYKAAGLNAVQSYIAWDLHEPEKGEYNFAGDLDFVHFFKLAQELDLAVILRPGPFVNAELDMGGLPYWLLSLNKTMNIRTMDKIYMTEVETWFAKLMPKIRPMLYENGGPVITVQVENEYGAYYACDHEYLIHLRDIFRSYLGNTVVLVLTGGVNKCESIDKVFVTPDFGSNSDPKRIFENLRKVQTGPFVNSEFYSGWINRWEFPYEHVDTQQIVKSLDVILSLNASVNIYPFGGGTLFGFMSGSKGEPKDFEPVVTSYEFDGPLTEAGDPNDKYFAIRDTIGKHTKLPSIPLPTVSPKMEIKNIRMKPIADIFSQHLREDKEKSENPLTFEDLKLGSGFVLYSHTLTESIESANLTIDRIGDRGLVFVNKTYCGLLSSTHKKYTLLLKNLHKGTELEILVENQGRYAYRDNHSLKGILHGVTLNNSTLKNWIQSRLFKNWSKTLSNIENLSKNTSVISEPNIPKFLTGTFQLPQNLTEPLDTFLSFEGWGKGSAFLNGFNLGRYWPLAGPQHTLYAPKNLFRKYPEENRITVFELERNPCNDSTKCLLNFVKVHVLNGTVAKDNGF